jgi:hypothetical protein
VCIGTVSGGCSSRRPGCGDSILSLYRVYVASVHLSNTISMLLYCALYAMLCCTSHTMLCCTLSIPYCAALYHSWQSLYPYCAVLYTIPTLCSSLYPYCVVLYTHTMQSLYCRDVSIVYLCYLCPYFHDGVCSISMLSCSNSIPSLAFPHHFYTISMLCLQVSLCCVCVYTILYTISIPSLYHLYTISIPSLFSVPYSIPSPIHLNAAFSQHLASRYHLHTAHTSALPSWCPRSAPYYTVYTRVPVEPLYHTVLVA